MCVCHFIHTRTRTHTHTHAHTHTHTHIHCTKIQHKKQNKTITHSWQFLGADTTLPQRFPLIVTVSFVPLPFEGTSEVVPSPPLPRLSRDFLYPLYISDAPARVTSSVVLTVVIMLCSCLLRVEWQFWGHTQCNAHFKWISVCVLCEKNNKNTHRKTKTQMFVKV